MKRPISLILSLMLVAVFAVGCAAPTPAPLPPTAVPPTAAPVVVVVTATPLPPTAVPTAAVQLPDGAVAQAGKLLICTDFPYPPQEFFDQSGNPQGLDVDIGTAIAGRLGLQVEFVNSVFDTIIPAVVGGKCDIVISAQNVTADRQKQVSMIPYFQAGQSMVAAKGNPQNINTTDDLCGKSVAAESGTTEADYIQGTGDYKDTGGLTQACTKGGKQAIDLVVTQKDTDALQQLQAGKVAVYFADSPVAGYYVAQHSDQFQLVGQVLEPAVEGISVPCGGAADCTSAPLSPLGTAVKAALQSMMADGAYGKILDKWGLGSGAVTLK